MYTYIQGDVWMTGRSDRGEEKDKRGWTLRFPRVSPDGIRLTSLGGTDKPWDQIDNTETFENHIRRTKEGEVGLGNRKQLGEALANGSTIFQQRKRKGKGETGGAKHVTGCLGIGARFQVFDASKVQVTSDILNGCVVCVLPAPSGEEEEREKVQAEAHELGAILVANHDEFTTHIIGMVEDQKFRNLKKVDKDIVSFMWMHECYEQRQLVPLEPRFMMHTSANRKAEFSRLYDRYEDSYTRDLDAQELRTKLEKGTLWAGMEDDSDGDMADDNRRELEDTLLQAYTEHRAGQEGAAVPSATMESQVCQCV
jgi:hypothetical protein